LSSTSCGRAGARLRRVARGWGSDPSLSWSPDDRRLVFSYAHAVPGHPAIICSFNLQIRAVTRLGRGSSPSWAPGAGALCSRTPAEDKRLCGSRVPTVAAAVSWRTGGCPSGRPTGHGSRLQTGDGLLLCNLMGRENTRSPTFPATSCNSIGRGDAPWRCSEATPMRCSDEKERLARSAQEAMESRRCQVDRTRELKRMQAETAKTIRDMDRHRRRLTSLRQLQRRQPACSTTGTRTQSRPYPTGS
jgi:hypothetical protein